MGGVGPVALPAFEAHLWVAGAVASVTDHVENVLLGHPALQRPPLALVVVWAVDVQVVVHGDLYGVALTSQAKRNREDGQKNINIIIRLQCFCYSNGISHIYFVF